MASNGVGQEVVEKLPIGAKMWLHVQDFLRFRVKLVDVEKCLGNNIGAVLLSVDPEDFTELLKDKEYVTKYRMIAVTEAEAAGEWTLTTFDTLAVHPDHLLFSELTNLKLVVGPHTRRQVIAGDNIFI